MLELIVLERAEEDLYDIIAYTSEAYGIGQARHYVEALRERIARICENPLLGQVNTDLRGKIRSVREGQHRIYYQVGEASLTIVRILHVRSDVGRHF